MNERCCRMLALGMLGLAAPVAAQLPNLGSLGGGLSGLLPNVASVGAGNAAGLLGYCVKRRLLGDASANSVLGKLTGSKAVTSSPEYSAGQDGQLVTGNSTLSLESVRDKVKGKICTMVLDRARSFVGK